MPRLFCDEPLASGASLALPAGAEAEAALSQVPHAPDMAALEAMFAREGVDVSAILVPERF